MKNKSTLNKPLLNNFKIGIAISTYNSAKVIRKSLSVLKNQNYKIVVFDDLSQDNTLKIAKSIIPDLEVIKGNGSGWWGGGTAKAVDKCFSLGCDFVLMLNPDTIIHPKDISHLVDYTSKNSRIISTGLIVRYDDKKKLFWGGSVQIKSMGIPIYASRYIYRKNFDVTKISSKPYQTDEVYGRGVLVSKSVYKIIGTLDWRKFPHYGADNDYSMRAKSAGIKLIILPKVKINLLTENSGMKLKSKPFSFCRIKEVYNFLMKRKNGEYISVLWRLHCRHISPILVIPSFLINLIYITFRKLSQSRL